MKAIVQDEYGSPSMKHHRAVVTRHGGPDVLQVREMSSSLWNIITNLAN